IGGRGPRTAVRERGFRPVTIAAEQPAAVVQGYTPDLSYSLLAEGGLAVAAGALFVASNADSTLPTPRGRQPGNGSLIQVIATATGRAPLIAGKPEPPLHAEAVAGPPAAPGGGGRQRGPPPARGGGPARHRYRERGPLRRRQPAGADRGDPAAGRGPGPPAAPADVPGRGPARAARPAPRGDGHRR